MKIFQFLSIFGVAVSLSVALYVFTKSSDKIAFVQSVEVLNKYKGMEDARKAYQQKSQTWKSKLDTLQSEFQIALTTYEKEQSGYSAKEKELSEKLIQNKRLQWINYQKQIESKAAEEDQKMTGEVLNQINIFLIKYGEEHGFTVIFGANQTGNIVYGDDAIDITTVVVEELNKTYSIK